MKRDTTIRKRLGVALVLAACLGGMAVSGCAVVKPWERETLARGPMQIAPRLGDAYLAHVLSIREGATGGEGGAGGGCGCN